MRKHIVTYSVEAILLGVGVVITALGVWAGAFLIAVGMVGLLWSRFGKNADKDVALRLYGQVKSLERVNETAVAMRRGKFPTAEGNIMVLVKAVFNPIAQSLAIAPFKLSVSGVELETEFPPIEVHNGSMWEGFFEVPQELYVNNIKAHLIAYVGEEHYHSPDFPITFDKIGVGHE